MIPSGYMYWEKRKKLNEKTVVLIEINMITAGKIAKPYFTVSEFM